MPARDHIAEIIEIRERGFSSGSSFEALMRIVILEQSFKSLPKDNIEMLRYFPIALVATMEGSIRSLLANLIDHGKPFLDNCEKLIKNQKIPFSLIKAFHGKEVAVGEFVSHTVSINKLADIDSVISTVIGTDFLEELKIHHDRWDVEVCGKDKVPMISKPDVIYRSIARTFELRHIFCHELAMNVNVDYLEIEQCMSAVSIFLKAANSYIRDTLYPNSPLTNVEINLESASDLKMVIDDINLVKAEIIAKNAGDQERIEQLELGHLKLNEFKECYSTFVADKYVMGTAYPQIRNSNERQLATDYLRYLQHQLEM